MYHGFTGEGLGIKNEANEMILSADLLKGKLDSDQFTLACVVANDLRTVIIIEANGDEAHIYTPTQSFSSQTPTKSATEMSAVASHREETPMYLAGKAQVNSHDGTVGYSMTTRDIFNSHLTYVAYGEKRGCDTWMTVKDGQSALGQCVAKCSSAGGCTSAPFANARYEVSAGVDVVITFVLMRLLGRSIFRHERLPA